MGHLGTSVPGFCTEFRYLSYGRSGFAWGAIFEKSPKIKKMYFFKKWTCPKIQKMLISRKKSRRRPTSTRQPEAFKNMGIYIYIYIYIYIERERERERERKKEKERKKER